MKEETVRGIAIKGFSALTWCLSIGVAVFCGPASALAAPNGVVATVTVCSTFEPDCVTVDNAFTADSLKASVNKEGVWTSSCSGTTSAKPAKETKCKGETLNGGTGDSDPQFACAIVVDGNNIERFVFTDDWSETITPSGHVTMTCKFDPKEKAK